MDLNAWCGKVSTTAPCAGRCVHQPARLRGDELDVHAAGLDQDPDETEGLRNGAQVRADPAASMTSKGVIFLSFFLSLTGSIDPEETEGLRDGAQVWGRGSIHPFHVRIY